jgi:very-short-patch-repair endonuclease
MKGRSEITRRLRSQSTEAERRMWWRLRNRQLDGLKFKRQVPIDRYVVDFVCDEAKLILEIDGSQHHERVADRKRTAALEAMEYLVLRFWNNEVLANTDGVLEFIIATVHSQTLEPPHPARSAPTSPQRGEV